MKYTKEEKQQAKKILRKYLKPGSTVYTSLERVSRSGMERSIKVFAIRKNQPIHLSHSVAVLTGRSRKRHEDGVTVGGCGMDMGFHLVYSIGRYLWPKGFKTKHGRNGDSSGFDKDGGYALNQEWL